jgi:signal transduction histidine kinase
MGVLMLRNDRSGELEPMIAEGLTDEQSVQFGRHRPGVGPIGRAASEQRRVTIDDVLLESNDAEPSFREVARALGFRGLDVVPLALEDGSVIGVLAALFKISRRPSARSARLAELCGRLMALALENARLRADAERRREIVESLARARVQFVARICHELRTPLQSITGYIDLLRVSARASLTPQQVRILDRVYESEQVLIHVIGDLTSMARLEAGRLDYDIIDVDANHAIASSVAIVQPLADQKGVDVRFTASTAPVIARADETKLKQILINLLANAVKFTPAGGAIHVSARERGPHVILEVADTGLGIPESDIDRVFEPYVQLANVSSIAGSGLGLAISREFASGMKGSLQASSRPGAGSVFTLRLPRGPDAMLDQAPHDVRPSPNPR